MTVFQRLGPRVVAGGPSKSTTRPDCSKASNQWRREPRRTPAEKTDFTAAAEISEKKTICRYWIGGRCRFGGSCKYLHSWSLGGDFSLLTQLHGHKNSVTGIAMVSDKLYTGFVDGTLGVWDCHSGKSESVVDLKKGAVGCLISEGKWVFIGLMNLVLVRNTETSGEQTLAGTRGQVRSLAVTDTGLLFAGGDQSGAILAWKFNVEARCFEESGSVVGGGHRGPVVSLVLGNAFLYSSSTDKTIRQWNTETLECMQVLEGHHGSTVTSLLCWNQFLMTSSLDKTVKVWGNAENGKDLEVVYTHKEEQGVVSLAGMLDPAGKPMLLCSCTDKTVRIYELPSFADKGRIFSAAHGFVAGDQGLFFTGDDAIATGSLKVWMWNKKTLQTRPGRN